MVSLYIFARAYPPALFASLTGLIIGVSSVGNLAAATRWPGPRTPSDGAPACGCSRFTLLTTVAPSHLVRDPPRVSPPDRPDAGLLAVVREAECLL